MIECLNECLAASAYQAFHFFCFLAVNKERHFSSETSDLSEFMKGKKKVSKKGIFIALFKRWKCRHRFHLFGRDTFTKFLADFSNKPSTFLIQRPYWHFHYYSVCVANSIMYCKVFCLHQVNYCDVFPKSLFYSCR